MVIIGVRSKSRATKPDPAGIEQAAIGAVAGIMGVCLAMPGPVPAAWMASKGFAKESIRATILAMFVVSYSVALVLQAGFVGVGAKVAETSVLLAPATIVGVVAGQMISHRITERTFGWILVAVLVSTATMLFLSI
jgi:uncharacterized membrane protein YfcA